jgi:hypothetical protein
MFILIHPRELFPSHAFEMHGIYLKSTRGVSHCGHAIYIKKYFKAKEESWKLKYFTMQKKKIYSSKKSSKGKQNPSRYYESITNLKFPTQAKISSFKKSSYKNRPIT